MILRSCTIQTARSVAVSVQAELDAGTGLEIDCSGVEQADITFVQMLVAAQRSCAARDLPFALGGLSDVVASAFQRAGVTVPGSMPSELSGI